MWKSDDILMLVAAILLVVVNWLAFHDIHETHTVRDWLMLAATILVFVKFALEIWQRYFRKL
jgi:hypothetical protein